MATSSLNAFNTQAMKLAAMGVTIFAASGDDGVAGFNYACNSNSGSAATGGRWTGAAWTGQGYFPMFPASNPYVTAVGATMGARGYPPASQAAEVACQSAYSNSSSIKASGGEITSGMSICDEYWFNMHPSVSAVVGEEVCLGCERC